MKYNERQLLQEISYLSSKLASTEAGYEKLKDDIRSNNARIQRINSIQVQ